MRGAWRSGWLGSKLFFPLVVSLLVGTAFLVVGLRDHLKDTEILSHGSRAIGTVIERKNTGFEENEWSITYTFALPNGRSLTHTHTVSWQLFSDLKVGDSVEVAFASADPTRNFIAEHGARPLGHIILWSLIFALVAYGLTFSLVEYGPWGRSAQT